MFFKIEKGDFPGLASWSAEDFFNDLPGATCEQ